MADFWIKKLKEIRRKSGQQATVGLSDQVVRKFLSDDANLRAAIDAAFISFEQLRQEYSDLFLLEEKQLRQKLQTGFLNFYSDQSITPYVALAAKGPWLVTAHGAVLYDVGSYGMLGLGHAPEVLKDVLSRDFVMANVLTPSFSHYRFSQKLKERIGLKRSDQRCPYDKFVCLNAGSGAISFAARISDLNAKRMTDPGGRHQGKKIVFLGLEKGFHGRTSRPAQVSHAMADCYQALASFRDRDNLLVVKPNRVDELEKAFAYAAGANMFIEAMFIEPVMGEGNPGQAIEVEFYRAARRLTAENGSLLIVDSIQAALRAHGVLSILDYPGFSDVDPPDMEAFSKALNAGQYPLSTLALTQKAADIYQTGVYGNTMSANPRALEIAGKVLDQVDTNLQANIRNSGLLFLQKLKELQQEMPAIIENVQGTGLLLSAEVNRKFPVVSQGGLEERARKEGLNVIHGGTNALRFTPWFHIKPAEVELVMDVLRSVLKS